MNNSDTNPAKVDPKTRKRVLWRWFFTSSVSSNYEKMQALAYCYAMLPFLKVAYRNHPDKLQKSVLNHLQFFNTNPWVAPYILGINVALEESGNDDTDEAVTSIKTGLMGPVAGLGDSLFVVIPWTIFGAIAANMALQGSPVGIFLWIAVSVALKMLSVPLFNMGYTSGTRLISTIEKSLKTLTESTSVLGLMVVGALIPSVVKATVALNFSQGKFNMKGQTILDQIMPGLIPAALVGVVYWLLKKNVKPIWLILGVMVFAVLMHVLGILK